LFARFHDFSFSSNPFSQTSKGKFNSVWVLGKMGMRGSGIYSKRRFPKMHGDITYLLNGNYEPVNQNNRSIPLM
jgi:hypothetical protein